MRVNKLSNRINFKFSDTTFAYNFSLRPMEVYEKELTILGSNIDPFTFPEAVSLTAAMHQVRALEFIHGQLREGTRSKRLGGREDM